MGLAEILKSESSRDIIPADVDPRELRKLEEEELERRIEEESGPCITRKPAPVECLELGIDLAKAQVMKPEDLTREDAEKLLTAGITKYRIMKLYNFKGPGTLYIKLKKWGLYESKEKQNTKMEKPESPYLDFDLSKFEQFGEASPVSPALYVSPKELRISGTDLQPGDRVVFYINSVELQYLEPGRLVIIKKSETGRALYYDRNSKRACRISCRSLMKSLQQKGVPLPARYKLEWSEKMQAWVGRLIDGEHNDKS